PAGLPARRRRRPSIRWRRPAASSQSTCRLAIFPRRRFVGPLPATGAWKTCCRRPSFPTSASIICMSKTTRTIADSARLCDAIVEQLEDGKAVDIVRMDVSKLTTMTDFMVVATGTSNRHVKALAANTAEGMRERGTRVRGVEGEDAGEWI